MGGDKAEKGRLDPEALKCREWHLRKIDMLGKLDLNSCGALEWEHLYIFSQKYQYVDIPNLSWVFYIIYAIDTVIPSKSEVLNNGTRLAPGILNKKLWTYW